MEVALVRGKDHLVSRYTLTCFLPLLERWRPRPWKRPSGESLHSCFLLLLERWRPRPWKRPPGESLHSYLFSPPIRKVAVAIVLGKDHLVSRYTLTCFLPLLERWRPRPWKRPSGESLHSCFLLLLERWRPHPWKRPPGESLHSYLFSPPIRKVAVAIVLGKDHLVSRYTLTCFLTLIRKVEVALVLGKDHLVSRYTLTCFLPLLERWRPRPWKRPSGESLHSYLFSPPIRKVETSSLEKTTWWVVTLLFSHPH